MDVAQLELQPGGATRMARGDIRLVHGLTKSTLITYFSGMKIDPKYAFLHAFFLICLSCPSQNLLYMTKNTPFFSNFARFCTPKWCTRVHCLVLKNSPNYVNFWTNLIPPLTFECPPQLQKYASVLINDSCKQSFLSIKMIFSVQRNNNAIWSFGATLSEL